MSNAVQSLDFNADLNTNKAAAMKALFASNKTPTMSCVAKIIDDPTDISAICAHLKGGSLTAPEAQMVSVNLAAYSLLYFL